MNNTLDLTHLPKEVLLILEIFKEKDKREKVVCIDSLSKEVDWQLFLDYAIHHRVYPMLYKQLKQLKDSLNIPLYVIQSLEGLYKRNTFDMLQLSAEMNEIGKLFADQGIDTLFLKGPILSYELFGDISLRTSRDLDILIPLDHLSKAQSILKELGYEQAETIESLFNEWKWRGKDVSFYHAEKQITIEVHWRLNYWPEQEPSFKELWSRRRESTITQHPCSYLGKEDLFHYLVTHGARHAWFRLRWLMDIHQITKQSLDWQSIYLQFKKYNHVFLCGQALILTSQLTNLNITEDMKPFLKRRSLEIANSAIYFIERMENLHDGTLPKEVLTQLKKYNSSIMITRTKIMKILARLYPSLDDSQMFPLPRFLYFLYFPLRPILWISRKGKRLVLTQDELK